MKAFFAAVAVVSVAASPALTTADPALRLLSPSVCTTASGSVVSLEPGRFLVESLWMERETEFLRLQTAEIRLKAENKSLRASSGLGWGTTILILAGFSGGIYLGTQL